MNLYSMRIEKNQEVVLVLIDSIEYDLLALTGEINKKKVYEVV